MQEGEDIGQTVIKMTNTKLGISTFWTMDKFEDKLIQMREMFQVRVVLLNANDHLMIIAA